LVRFFIYILYSVQQYNVTVRCSLFDSCIVTVCIDFYTQFYLQCVSVIVVQSRCAGSLHELFVIYLLILYIFINRVGRVVLQLWWLEECITVRNIVFFWKTFVLIGIFGVPIIFLGFKVEQIPSGSSHTNFWILYTFKVLNIVFLGIFLFWLVDLMFRQFCLTFWVELANSVG
jgi:hypothetical protein